MKAMILAAGLGTRLKPWTLHHPKALVDVGGKPMLARVIEKLRSQGFDEITVNIHHFGDQIVSFLEKYPGGNRICVSDETRLLMDTGGGIVAAESLRVTSDPVLVHNVDILSDADLSDMMRKHESSGADVSLLVSDRSSSRKLIFGENMLLKGWHSLTTGELRPPEMSSGSMDKEYAFSGIYIVNIDVILKMEERFGRNPFPVMEFFLASTSTLRIHGILSPDMRLIDIGKPDTLSMARSLFV